MITFLRQFSKKSMHCSTSIVHNKARTIARISALYTGKYECTRIPKQFDIACHSIAQNNFSKDSAFSNRFMTILIFFRPGLGPAMAELKNVLFCSITITLKIMLKQQPNESW